jgi:hypothetical protein
MICVFIFVYNRIYQIIFVVAILLSKLFVAQYIFTSMFIAIEIIKNSKNLDAILLRGVYIQHYIAKYLFIFYFYFFLEIIHYGI